jgi:hypothetical protein
VHIDRCGTTPTVREHAHFMKAKIACRPLWLLLASLSIQLAGQTCSVRHHQALPNIPRVTPCCIEHESSYVQLPSLALYSCASTWCGQF